MLLICVKFLDCCLDKTFKFQDRPKKCFLTLNLSKTFKHFSMGASDCLESQTPAVIIISVNLRETGSSLRSIHTNSKLAPGIQIMCQSGLKRLASICLKLESPIIKIFVLSVKVRSIFSLFSKIGRAHV